MENNTRWQEFNSIIDNEVLNPKEKLLLLTIFRYYNQEKRYSYPSKKLLKAKCSITHDRDYYKYINNLEINNYIIKETIKGMGCKFYLTNCQKVSYLQNNSNWQKGSDTHCQNDSQPTAKKVVQKENKRKMKEDIYTESIQKIINLYPGKKTKAIREKKLPGIIKQYGEEQIMRCVERYAKECRGKEKQFILNESTFWNGRYIDYLDQELTQLTNKKTIEERLKFRAL